MHGGGEGTYEICVDGWAGISACECTMTANYEL